MARDPGSSTSRRDFLKLTGLTVGSTSLPLALPACAPGDEETRHALDLRPDYSTIVYRPEDFVALGFGFVNLRPNASGQLLERIVSGRAAYIIVDHHPQHVLEQAFHEPTGGSTGSVPPAAIVPIPIPSRIAGESRVVFKVPADVDQVTYDEKTLLDACRTYEMNVAANATPPDPPPPVFFVHPVLGSVAALPSPSLTLQPTLGTTFASQHALVVCDDNGQPPALSSANALSATRITQAYRLASLITGEDFFPIARPVITTAILKPRAPGTGETALELPFRLTVSPSSYGQWAHAVEPVKGGKTGRTELWHSRLGVRNVDKDGHVLPADEVSSYYRTIRALWTRDQDFSPDDADAVSNVAVDPFLASLGPRDRSDIVHLTTNYTLRVGRLAYKPPAVKVNRLMLTSLGAWLDARGDFGDTPPSPISMSLWEHRATFGRDHYVKVVRTGVLYPFGHRAVLIQVSERKLKTEPLDGFPGDDTHPHIGYVRQQLYIMIKQPVVKYEQGRNTPFESASVLRQEPFTYVHIKTLKTPPLDQHDIDGKLVIGSSPLFWPTVNGQAFRFDCEATDLEGNTLTFTTPAYFVKTSGGVANPADLSAAAAAFNGKSPTWVDMGGHQVAYAPASDGRPDDTTFDTKRLRFEGREIPGNVGYAFPFAPIVAEAELQVPAVRALAGNADATSFSYDTSYITNAFGAGNTGEVLLKIGGALAADFAKQADRSGGLIAPSISLSGLSRKLGPVGGMLSDAAANSFNPSQFFGGIEALLFGSINLFDIIDVGSLLNQAPQFLSQTLNKVESLIREGKAIIDLADKAAMTGQMKAANVKTKTQQVVDDVTAILAHPDSLLMPATETNLLTHIGDLSTALGEALPLIDMWTGYTKAQIDNIKRQIKSVMALIDQASGQAMAIIDGVKKLAQGFELAKNLHVSLEWRPLLRRWPFDMSDTMGKKAIFLPAHPEKTLLLSLDLRGKDLPGGKKAGFDLLCSLEDFALQLIAPVTMMSLKFTRVAFSVSDGKKPDIDVQFDGFDFGGILAFVKELMKVLPVKGFSDPPSIDVSKDGIKAHFDVAIPSVAVGVFSLRNISLGGGFEVPFIGKPLTVSFNFCTREHPFELTVSMIGGGGFFGITLYPKGVYMLEAALEFGAALSVDLGVASGSVEVKGGVYFKMQASDCTLTGYFRIRGEVDVLGIISACIELYMDLTYESAGNKLIGHASLEIEIDIFMFSFSVTVSVEKRFAGDGADPTFAQIMAPEAGFDPWAEYQNAFAA